MKFVKRDCQTAMKFLKREVNSSKQNDCAMKALQFLKSEGSFWNFPKKISSRKIGN